MRGSPLWQVLAVAVAFVAMGLPVWRLTRPAEAAPLVEPNAGGKRVSTPQETANVVTLDAEADFAPVPSEFSLSYLGTPLLQGKAQAKATMQAKTPIPADGADLVLHVVWPGGAEQSGGVTQAAARVIVSLSDGRQVEKSFWSADGTTLDTVLSVPGKTADAAP